MKIFDPKLLQIWTHGQWTQWPQQPIHNFCFDTRQLQPNECFIALKGAHNDGHTYVKMAQAKGAVAAIVEQKVEDCNLPQLVVTHTLRALQAISKRYRQTLMLPIVGITGSCGKTTFKELLSLLLGPRTFKTFGNFNNFLGLPFSITQIDPEKHTAAVLEIGISKPDEMDCLGDLSQPDIAVILNVHHVHLQNFSSLEAIAQEKFKLLSHTQAACFVPYDLRKNLPQKLPKTVYTFSSKAPTADLFYQLQENPQGWQVTLANGTTFSVPFPIGKNMANSFALAIAIAQIKGISSHVIHQRLQQWQPTDLRGVWKRVKGHHYFIDCYNANPVAFEDSLQHFYRTLPTDTDVCYCIGSMLELGSNSPHFHQELAQHFQAHPNDRFVCIGDFCTDIATGLLTAGIPAYQIFTAQSTREAQPHVNSFTGHYFYIKGSHDYHLENLVAQ